jgi:hypothetical protein
MTDLAGACEGVGDGKVHCQHADQYGRIEFIVIDRDVTVRPNLSDER